VNALSYPLNLRSAGYDEVMRCALGLMITIACSGTQQPARIEPARPSIYMQLVAKRIAAKGELDAARAEVFGVAAQQAFIDKLRRQGDGDDRVRMQALFDRYVRESPPTHGFERLKRAWEAYDRALRMECNANPLAQVCRSH
jgi:hypothetical protein